MVIREAVYDDVRACAQLIAAHESDDVDAWQRRFEAAFKDVNRSFIVALAGEEVVGYGHTALHVRADDSDHDATPTGYFLSGLLVSPEYRRHRIGTRLTIARLEMLRGLTDVVYYVADPENIATIEMHTRLGFNQLRSVNRNGGTQILFRLDRLDSNFRPFSIATPFG